MPKSANICLALSLLTCAACSTRSEVASAPPLAYDGIPAGLMERCTVKDVDLVTTGDIVTSRNAYKDGFEKCAAKVEAIRAHDAEARAVSSDPAKQ
ncbi:Rz1-like lysis system protein LysC [Novosphingobium resinovorum]|uniref:Rz1-like lysis system protein LysC n=1 Tax=Novosphingobium resinovorum TaxID=158500 RepID=UPI001E39178B|nr:Rz1-like lysis system protein LysC [Novosphingobium resinovorum]